MVEISKADWKMFLLASMNKAAISQKLSSSGD